MKQTLALLTALVIALPLLAQDAGPEKKEPPTGDEIAERQAKIRLRLKSIEETMERVASVLSRTNPEQAARLMEAFRRSKVEDSNIEKLTEIENYLRSGYFEQALSGQKEITRALERLLDILLDRDADRKELAEEIKRLESLQQQLNKIIEDERNLYHETEKHANPEETLRRAAAAKAKLEDLIKREQQLIDRTKASGDAPNEMELADLQKRVGQLLKEQQGQRGKNDAAKQEALSKKAEKLAKDIKDFAKRAGANEGASPAAAKPGGNPGEQAAGASENAANGMAEAAAKMKGGSPFGDPQKQAEQDLKEAKDALRRLKDRLDRKKDADLAKKQARIRKDTERLKNEVERLNKSAPGSDGGGGALGKAQGEMREAEKGLGKGDKGKAVPHEEEAKKELERAYKKLEELEKELKRLIKLPDYDKLADKQEKTEGDTDDLLKKMKGGSPQEGGQQGGEGTPGEGQVEQAKRAMQRAKRNLRQRSAKSAKSDEKEALDRLKKAQEELEEALRQLKEEQQLMLLDALERRLGRMLAKQIRITKDTIALNLRLKSAKKPARADVDKSKQLAEGERELEGEAHKMLEILREEGTTVVIPEVVNDLKEDFQTLDERLMKLQTAEYTQQIQRDIEETLRQLIKVIQEERERRQGGGGGGQDSGEGDPDENLLPTSAELKMLREMQVRVSRRTVLYEKMKQHDETLATKRSKERDRIAKKQKSVGSLTRTMADKLNREEE